jgi:hypothetical protein
MFIHAFAGVESVALLGLALLIPYWLHEAYDSGKDAASRFERSLDSKRFARELAALLEIQADGGDSPEDVVSWAMGEAAKRSAANP